MSPRSIRTSRRSSIIASKKVPVTTWDVENPEEVLAVSIVSNKKSKTPKQSTLEFPIKKRLNNKSTKKSCSEKTDNSVVEAESNFNENQETVITTPVKTPKRRLFDKDDESSPSKRNYSPSKKTPSSLLKQLDLEDTPKTNSSLKPKCLFSGGESSYSSARQALHASQPVTLPGREKHLETLEAFILSQLQNKSAGSGSIYLSGAPGTGKTASVNLTLQQPKIKSTFKLANINCTSVKTSKAIFIKVADELNVNVKGNSEKDYISSIQHCITHCKKKILLVLDEIDQLESRHQSVLYTIFEWPALNNSQLTLIGIANSLDLTDRLLPRLQARTSYRPQLLHFAPYTKQQISSIINQRLEEAGVSQVFKGIAVEMLAAKVAAVSGDARRALDIGRRVVELADTKHNSKNTVLKPTSDHGSNTSSPRKSPRKGSTEEVSVGILEVRNVLDGVYGTTQSLIPTDKSDGDGLPMQQKLLICSLLLMLRKGNSKDITVAKLHAVYSRVCSKRNLIAVSQSEFYNMCTLVETRGILQVAVVKKEIRQSKVSLQWDDEEVSSALCDKMLLASILSDVSCLTGR